MPISKGPGPLLLSFHGSNFRQAQCPGTGCQWEVQNTDAIDDEDVPKATLCVPLVDPGIY